MTTRQLQALARTHGTPLVVIDHDIIRRNYAEFKKHLPKVQAYYAVKANPAPEIVRTLYRAGASFDVASMPEFMTVYENIRHLPTPFGGMKSSGIGRDGGDYSFEFYMETKNIAIALGDHKISRLGV